MRLLKMSPNGKQVNIGEDSRSAKWYYLTDAVKIDGIEINDEVTIGFDQRGNGNYLTFFAKGKVDVPTEVRTPAPSGAKSQDVRSNSNGYKSDNTMSKNEWLEKDLRIQRQSVGKMTAEAVKVYAGTTMSVETLCETIEKVYDTFAKKVNG